MTERVKVVKEIIELQRRIDRARRQYTHDAWMKLNLTIPQLKSLFFISNQGSTNFTKLATALVVTPSNVTGIVDRLVEQGLVSRQENPEDRRMLLLKTTPQGEALVAELRERRTSGLSAILAHLNLEELKSVAEGLTVLARTTETLEKNPG